MQTLNDSIQEINIKIIGETKQLAKVIIWIQKASKILNFEYKIERR